MNINSLERFVQAQALMYHVALEEIKSAKKQSHWMWYMFPQLRGLGTSFMAHTYGISDLDEATILNTRCCLGDSGSFVVSY